MSAAANLLWAAGALCALALLGCLSGCAGGDRFEGTGESWAGKLDSEAVGGAGAQRSFAYLGTGGAVAVSMSTGGTPAQSSNSRPLATGGSLSSGAGGTSDTGSSIASPCEGLCDKPVRFALAAGSWTSPELGSEPSCFETYNQIKAGNCTNCDGRTLFVNGQAKALQNWQAGPARAAGWCVQVSVGLYAYANLQVF